MLMLVLDEINVVVVVVAVVGGGGLFPQHGAKVSIHDVGVEVQYSQGEFHPPPQHVDGV